MNRDDAIALAKVRLEETLTFFGINTKVQIDENDDRVELLVETDDSGRLIGRHGENLRALQHLLNMMLHQRTEERLYWSVDIGGYKKAQAEAVMARATEQAQKVVETGEIISLPPMSPADRRLVHMAVGELDGAISESSGNEPQRYVVIKPAS